MTVDTKDTLVLSRTGGTVTAWRVGAVDVFYPQQTLLIDGVKKLRGGMHACFPNFGEEQSEYALPQHGPLRDKEGSLEKGGNRVSFGGRDILGTGPYADASVEVFTRPGGFTYTLSVMVSPEARMAFPTNAGFHPYFRTPEKVATVFLGDRRHDITGLVKEPRVLPVTPSLRLYSPGVGVVNIYPGDRFLKTNKARFILWRDSEEYICVEPVLGTSNDFMTGASGWLMPGKTFQLSCSFELV